MIDLNKPFLERDEDYRAEIRFFYAKLFNNLDSDEIMYIIQMLDDELKQSMLRYINPLDL
ncbi:MAG: hypothetical protein E6147_06165 [Peptostreptococcus sp.]|uniref:hypothetical protein n=1 Tax=Peptostreptococcus sp. TaxID=1262 RepID=UPI002912EC57|nr:hypothetical protein [Peptostreptococcus sp.]MDU5350562.1 hypothetical protein [Peptostreptococcus sp.]MDU5892108.1 hypothetical protein [Peptostreptococcus sp.]